MSATSKAYTVSVCCITYNHEAFVAQTIESVLMQETDFAVELVIGEDCSPDATRQVAHAYAQRYPGRVRVLAHAHNLGIMRNLMATMAACTGEFVAFLEGDDYWTDPTKLQRQVNLLRAKPDAAFCFHDAEIVYEVAPPRPPAVFSQHIAPHALPPPSAAAAPVRFTQAGLGQAGWIVPSASMLFRASSLPQPLPEWFAGVFSGDYTLQLLSTQKGAAYYLPQIMAHYRVHAGSVTVVMAQSERKLQQRIYEAQMYRQHVFRPENNAYGDVYLAKQYFGYASFLGAAKRWRERLHYLIKGWFYARQRLPLFVRHRLSSSKVG